MKVGKCYCKEKGFMKILVLKGYLTTEKMN